MINKFKKYLFYLHNYYLIMKRILLFCVSRATICEADKIL